MICSRRMRLTLSTDCCMRRKLGIIRAMTIETAAPSTGTATAMSHDSPTARGAMTTPPTIMIGAETMIASPM